jgi:hypothetical protein
MRYLLSNYVLNCFLTVRDIISTRAVGGFPWGQRSFKRENLVLISTSKKLVLISQKQSIAKFRGEFSQWFT